MEEIYNLNLELTSGKNHFISKIINLNLTNFSIDLTENISDLNFTDCIFNGYLEIDGIENPNLSLRFKECIFNGDVMIDNVNINNLFFIDTKKIERIEVSGDFNCIKFNNKNFPLKGSINISNCNIIKYLSFEKFNLVEGDLNIQFNNNKNYDYSNFSSSFKNAVICNGEISESFLGNFANFREFNITDNFTFDDCKFNKSVFRMASFGNSIIFSNCKFHSYTGFEECKSLDQTCIKISSCLFTSFPHFNNSEFNKIEILHTTFERKVSFDSVKCSTINLYQVTFGQGAFFDDLQIRNIESCDRKTFRTIKQEIQKVENKIDYNRFRVYEFNAYQKDLKNKLKKSKLKDKQNHIEQIQLRRDSFVLYVSKWVSDYGTDWVKALKFTLSSGFLIYILFFIIENYNHTIYLKNWTHFISGFFRFFLVTDFFNPLENDRTYLTNPLSWLIFIIGKIVIAFGIYEIIQSFRKFKA